MGFHKIKQITVNFAIAFAEKYRIESMYICIYIYIYIWQDNDSVRSLKMFKFVAMDNIPPALCGRFTPLNSVSFHYVREGKQIRDGKVSEGERKLYPLLSNHVTFPPMLWPVSNPSSKFPMHLIQAAYKLLKKLFSITTNNYWPRVTQSHNRLPKPV